MELNTVRQDIAFNKTVFNCETEQSVESEIMLPDYYGDIKRILKCISSPQIHNRKISGETLFIDGNCALTLVFVDADNRICGYSYDLPFKKSININPVGENADIFVRAEAGYCNCRAVTPRKAEYRGTVKLSVKISQTDYESIVTDVDLDGIQLKRENCPATNPLAHSEKVVVFEEDLELDRNDTLIKSVFRKSVYGVIEECKMLGSKAAVKGDLIVKILYTDENDKFITYDGKIPFNQIVDINADGDDCRCDALVNINSYEIKPRTNISGEARSFSLESKMVISVTASCDNDISAVTDIYSLQKPVKFSLSDITLKKLINGVKEKYICTKAMEFSENTFGTVIDLSSYAKVINHKIADGELKIEGTVTVCFLLTDTDGEPQYFERDIDFDYIHPLTDGISDLTAECNVFAESLSYTITSDSKIEVRVELSVECTVFSVSKRNVLTDIEICEDCEVPKKNAPITVYYCDAGESAWDIAKKYNCDYAQLLKTNDVECEIIPTAKMLLIV